MPATEMAGSWEAALRAGVAYLGRLCRLDKEGRSGGRWSGAATHYKPRRAKNRPSLGTIIGPYYLRASNNT